MNEDLHRRPGDAAARLAELRAGKNPTEPEVLVAEEVEEGTDESFSILSADRHQKIMLELRFMNGDAKALAYSYLVGIDFDPSGTVELDFAACRVRLSGRNLRPLFAGLVAQRVAFVPEVDELYAQTTAAEATVVTRIEVATRSS